ncbi:MAG: lysophospholipid acyltransferase family protein [Planctomycetota bacterium]
MNELPHIPGWFQDGFHRFLPRFFRKQFDAIALADRHRPPADIAGDGPLVVYANHPSWWDPLIAQWINRRLFRGRQFRAPIDADALRQYQVFKKLGFFGIEAGTRAGAAEFLKHGRQVMQSPRDALWLTPEGRFADVRDHDADLMPGLSHLCHGQAQKHRDNETGATPRDHGADATHHGCVIAMALEYVFWNERLPVCLIQFSQPIHIDQTTADWPKAQWHQKLSDQLRRTQNELAELAKQRQFAGFEVLLEGRGGGGKFYDSFRRLKSWIRRESFQDRHESRSQSTA